MKGSTDRLLAVAMLGVAVACFAELYLALGGKPKAAERLISPQVGEMPGRAEGGAVPPAYGSRENHHI